MHQSATHWPKGEIAKSCFECFKKLTMSINFSK